MKLNPDTMHFFKDLNHDYFFLITQEINLKLTELHQDLWQFDQLLDSFSTLEKIQFI